jgi:hypothetical protein
VQSDKKPKYDNMKNIILIFFCGFFINVNGQSPMWSWAESPEGGNNYSSGNSVTVDSFGNSYMTGSFSTQKLVFGNDTLFNTDNSGNTKDVFIVKYDLDGNIVWAKNVGGNYHDFGNSITTDGSGNIYITGSFGSPTIVFGSYTLTSLGNFDVYIAKYDANGNVIWATRAGGTSQDESNSIALDSFGNVYIAGYFRNTPITFGAYTLTNNGYADMFVAKYSSAGNAVWAKSNGGGYFDDQASSVTTDVYGNIYVAIGFLSNFISVGTNTLTNAYSGYNDIALVKYDSNGNPIWAKRIGGTSDEWPLSVSSDNTGHLYMTGYFSSSSIILDTDTLNNVGANTSDLFISKYDYNGNVIWSKRAGGINSELGRGVTCDISNNVYLVGSFSSSSIIFNSDTLLNTSNGSSDIFITKLDSSGNLIWLKGAAGNSNDYANSVAVDNNGNSFVAGNFHYLPIIFDSDTLSNIDGSGMTYKMYIAKLNANFVTSVGRLDAINQNITIYPNPASNILTITNIKYKTSIRIFDIMGKLVLEKEIENNTTFDISLLNQGVFTILVDNTKSRILKKIVIVK